MIVGTRCMMMKCKYLFITLFVALTMGCITACRESDTPKGNVETLSAPGYAKADFWNVTWVDVENANGYTVRLPDVKVEVKTEETSLSLFEYFKPDTKYSIEIKANGDGVTYLDSEWKTITYHTEAVTKGLVYDLCGDGTYEVMCKADKVPENGEIVYPDTYNGKPVTSISAQQKSMFEYFPYPTLYRVRLPASLTNLAPHAFNNSRIKEIYLPEGLERMWGNVFVGCKYLATVSMPKSLQRIDHNVFEDCTSLQIVELPASLTFIGDFAFYNSGLTKISVPDNLEYFGIHVYHNTAWYNAQADGVLYAGDTLYCYKGEMTEGTVLNNLAPIRKVADYAFINEVDREAYSLTEKYLAHLGLKGIVLPEGCTTIGSYAFFQCKNLEQVVFPESLTTIKDEAFYKCESLQEVVLPESLTTIGRGAFWHCENLKNINFPKNLTSIGVSAFAGCGMEIIQIPQHITTLWGGIFASCEHLKKVVLPSTMEGLDIRNFEACPNLNLIIPSTIKSVTVGSFLSADNYSFNIYFEGSEEVWNNVASAGFEKCTELTIYFYSEEQPNEEGNFWHYDTDGNPAVWA